MNTCRALSLSRAILFFTMSALIFGMQSSEVKWYGITFSTLPVIGYPLGAIVLVVSIVFMVASFRDTLAKRLQNALDDYAIKLPLLFVFWLVYYMGWIKALSTIPADRWGFGAILYVGAIWFLAIPFALFRDELCNLLKKVLKRNRSSS